jgi:hypothetical protein
LNIVLGALCLGVLWTAALLVAGSALQDLRSLFGVRARLRPLESDRPGVGLFECTVLEGAGPGGALATHEVVQIGRALDGDLAAIAFRDVSHVSRVHGGVVCLKDTRLAIDPEAGPSEVWPSRRARDEAEHDGGQTFDEAHAAARSMSGHLRTVTATVWTGERIFLAGEIVRRGDAFVVCAPPSASLLVAMEDPRALVSRQCALVVTFVLAELLVCSACTALALTPPVFGSVSTAGGALCLALFLGVTPVGVWVRDRCLPPNRAPLHGIRRAGGTSSVRAGITRRRRCS